MSTDMPADSAREDSGIYDANPDSSHDIEALLSDIFTEETISRDSEEYTDFLAAAEALVVSEVKAALLEAYDECITFVSDHVSDEGSRSTVIAYLSDAIRTLSGDESET